MIPLVLLAIPVVGAAASVFSRKRRGSAIEREYDARFGRNANGVVLGAESIEVAGTNGKALLLLHGSGDSPQSLRFLASRLNDAGFSVHAPLLPGHGRSPRAFDRATADDYLATARQAFDALSATHEWVGVIGLSMGGALAVRVTAASPAVRVLVLLAPYVRPPRVVRSVLATSWLWGLATPYLRGRGEASVHDEAARNASRAYGFFSAGALRALVRTAAEARRVLPSLRLPVLVVNSEEDNRIARDAAEATILALRAPVEVRWLRGCGHVITVDYCKDDVARLVLDFLARHAG